MGEGGGPVAAGEQRPQQSRVRGLTPRVEPDRPQRGVDAVAVAAVLDARADHVVEEVELQLAYALALELDPLLLPAGQQLEVETRLRAVRVVAPGARRRHPLLQVVDVDDDVGEMVSDAAVASTIGARAPSRQTVERRLARALVSSTSGQIAAATVDRRTGWPWIAR